MNRARVVANAFRHRRGFTYVMDSTLWECDACGERVTYLGRRGHAKNCAGTNHRCETNERKDE
jgi:hypothetical protein